MMGVERPKEKKSLGNPRHNREEFPSFEYLGFRPETRRFHWEDSLWQVSFHLKYILFNDLTCISLEFLSLPREEDSFKLLRAMSSFMRMVRCLFLQETMSFVASLVTKPQPSKGEACGRTD